MSLTPLCGAEYEGARTAPGRWSAWPIVPICPLATGTGAQLSASSAASAFFRRRVDPAAIAGTPDRFGFEIDPGTDAAGSLVEAPAQLADDHDRVAGLERLDPRADPTP